MAIFLDTHTWVWWVTEDRRLSRKAAHLIEEALEGELAGRRIPLDAGRREVRRCQGAERACDPTRTTR